MDQKTPSPMRFDLKALRYSEGESTRNKWAMEIGLLMVAFGSIETLTYLALKKLPSDPIAEPLKKLLLKDRIDVLLAVLAAQDTPISKAFAKLLREVQTLADKRNLVAHNGVGIDVWVDVSTGGLHATESIRSERNENKHLDFQRIVEHRKRAEELEFELYEMWTFVENKL